MEAARECNHLFIHSINPSYVDQVLGYSISVAVIICLVLSGSGSATPGIGKSIHSMGKVGRRKTTDMPELGVSLDEIPDIVSGASMNRDDKKKLKKLAAAQAARYEEKMKCAI